MHQISQESIDLAKKHAQRLQEHGLQLLEIGESLSKDEHREVSSEESAYLIRAGHQLQVYAQEIMSLAEIAEVNDEYSTDAYSAAVKAHTEATRLEIAASRIVQTATAKAADHRLNQLKDRSKRQQN